MRITTKGRYALRAMANLAASYQGKPARSRSSPRRNRSPPSFSSRSSSSSRRPVLSDRVRGPGGGFVLDKQPEEITVKDIFVAVDEGLDLTPCTACTATDGEDPCDRMDHCIVYSVWQEASDHIINYFDSITLRSILDKNHTRVQQLLAGNDVSA
jgi:Rrf2 family iron-sulfur cluster assembly transcriptional regulator